MGNSLIAAISNGVRAPVSVMATLDKWLGVPITLMDGGFWREFGGTRSFIGKRVTVDQALQLATVWACVRLISETIGTLPLGLYRRLDNGAREPATTHPLYNLLHNQPNADQTAAGFWEVVEASMLLWGNAYVEIIRTPREIVSLTFLHPECVSVKRLPNGFLEYTYRDPKKNSERKISQDNMMHIPAFSTDGMCGVSPIIYGANVFGTAIETDRASAETFRDSMKSPGIVTMDAILKASQREEIRAHVKSVQEDGGVMVLEKGVDFKPLGFDPKTAQLLASRQFNIEEMCRWFRVDPSMIGHGGKDSNWGTGLEQKMIWFLTFTLRHWCVRIEQSVRKSLLTVAEREKYFAEFNMEGLLRGDSASRAAFYSIGVDKGFISRDEVRKKENLAPRGGKADVLTVQSQMIDIEDMKAAPEPAQPQQNQFAEALITMIAEMKAQRDMPQPAPVIDARTTVTVEPAQITVNTPENAAPIVNVTVDAPVVDARTTVAPAPVTVNIPEGKAPVIDISIPGVAELVGAIHEGNVLLAANASEGTKAITQNLIELKQAQAAEKEIVLDGNGDPVGMRVKH